MTEVTTTNDAKEHLPYTQFACIGTGFSGIGLGATLKRWYDISDIQFFDRNPSLGGTWLANRYPGCACDVPTALYSYSYESNPDWTRILPPATELWEYLNGVAGKYGLHGHMTFGVEVKRAEWIESLARWRLTIVRLGDETEFHHECQFLFGATGQIVRPRKLDVPGVDTFSGTVVHSSQWRPDVDLTDKKVVVFGNGCTGAQLVAASVSSTKHLTHIVRTKHWFLPGMDAYIDNYTRAVLRIPGVSALSRFLVFIFAEDQLRAFYQNWDSKRYRKNMAKSAERYMRKTAPAKYHDLLIPEFEVGCKRRIFDPGYLKALHAENLELTNEAVLEIVPEGVKMADGRLIEADVIVACNGFQMQNFLSPIEVIGVGGETAEQHWQKMGGGPEAYNCVAMSGFPNFFAILGKSTFILWERNLVLPIVLRERLTQFESSSGPNTLTGHTSAIIASENSTNYALRIVKSLLDGKGTIAEVSPEAERKYVDQVQDALSKTVLATGCGSWYVSKLEDGREWNGTIYPWTQAHYWYRCLFPVWKDWQLRVSNVHITDIYLVE